jgi:glyceraldehyde 3-phosphate dehydrogenase
MTKIAINGFGRIGRHFLKIAWGREDIEVVALNDLTDTKTLAHLLKYDTAYPDFVPEVLYDNENLIVGGKKIRVFAQKNPAELPWGKLGVDIVVESTGVFRDKEKAGLHIEAGAKKVVLSAPGKGDGILTYVRGVNCESYDGADIIDNASCTTNCTAPVMRVLEQEFGVEKALLTTIHSYTTDQNLQDGPHKDLRRARAAAVNMVPTETGAASATAKVIPTLAERFDGLAVRVPTITVSLIDLSVVLKRDTTVDELNQKMREASETYLKDILAVTDEELVSSDFIGNPASSTVDLKLTNVVGGNLVKIISWYDNEWGYATRLVEMTAIVAGKL